MAAWVDAWAGARGGRAFHKTGTNGQSGGHTAEADDPPVAAMSSRSSHGDQQRCPKFRLISKSPWPTKKGRGSALCLARGTAIPNKLGPVGEGREDRHPAKT